MNVAALVLALLLFLGLSAAGQAPDANGETPLTAAVRHYDLNLVKSLLAHGANPNIGGGEGNKPPLLIAIDLGDVELVKTLIDAGADVRDCLVEATPNIKIMELLVASGVPMNPPGGSGWSALDSAAGSSHTDRAAFDFLLAHGAEIKPGTYSANEALTKAVEMGNLSVTETLLQRGVNPNFQHASFTELPLIVAVLDTDFPDTTLPMIELLLKSGADVNLRDDMGETALGWIASCAMFSRQGPQIATLLLDHGADVNAANGQQVTPLMGAVSAHQEEIVRLLLQHGAKTDPPDWSGETALSCAAYRYDESIPRSYPASVALIKMLIGAGAAVRGPEGGRALISAAASRNGGAAAALLAAGAPVNYRLEGTFYGGRILRFSEPDHRKKGPPELTPLMYAAANGDLDMVRTLIQHGAEIDGRDALGRTALMHAVWFAHDGIVKELLAHGADRHAVSKLGETPRSIARRQSLPQLVRLMKM